MCKIINKYTKTGNLKYISHLDVLRLIQRAVKRAGIHAKYSEGFNPHMKTAFGYPLSLGTESMGEYFELEISDKIDLNVYIDKMNNVLPKEMRIIRAEYTEASESLMSQCAYSEYLFSVEFENENTDIDELNLFLKSMVDAGIIFNREKKDKKKRPVIKELNTKSLIKYVNAKKMSEHKTTIEVTFLTAEGGSMKTDEFVRLIEEAGYKMSYYTIMKHDALNKNFQPLLP